jgi:hypothetical protein
MLTPTYYANLPTPTHIQLHMLLFIVYTHIIHYRRKQVQLNFFYCLSSINWARVEHTNFYGEFGYNII